MKKILFVLPTLVIFTLVPSVSAVNSDTVGQKTNPGTQIQQQVKTQNQGEDSKLQAETQEQENSDEATGAGSLNRSQTATNHMSEVAKRVQELLQLRTTGGIGDQVRLIARQQNQAQTQIQEHINKLDSKGQFARLITGTDFNAVKNLKAQLVQNRLRIKQLEELKTQLKNESDITLVQTTIDALVQENTSLQDKITSEEQTKSLFGWLFRFFAK